jgi:enamine deaminase RidA (YjgF/YER057c/UK114 family)
MRSASIALVALFLAACAPAAAPPAAPPARVVYLRGDLGARLHEEWHFAPVLRVGDVVIISGIPAARGDTEEAKVRTMFERAREALASAGATFDDVVEIQSFHVAPTHDDFTRAFAIVSKVHAEFVRPPYPAWTATGNASLLAKDAVAEMRLVAVVGSGARARVERVADAK